MIDILLIIILIIFLIGIFALDDYGDKNYTADGNPFVW